MSLALRIFLFANAVVVLLFVAKQIKNRHSRPLTHCVGSS